MQKIICTGRLTRNLELRYSNNNEPFVILPLAVINSSKESKPLYLDFISYGEVTKNHIQYLGKGSLIMIEGHIYQKIIEKDGKKIKKESFYADKVEYLNSVKSELNANKKQESSPTSEQQDPFKDFGEEIQLSDDDLPF